MHKRIQLIAVMTSLGLGLVLNMLLSVMGCMSSANSLSLHTGDAEWKTNVFYMIGLKMETPDWNADVSEHDNLLTIFAFPLVRSPVVDDQYGVTIQIRKLTEKDHRQYYPVCDVTTNAYRWVNSQHLEASQNTDNPYWTYVRRDLFDSHGDAYFCYAQIKHTDVTGRDLALEVRRMFESIQVGALHKDAQDQFRQK